MVRNKGLCCLANSVDYRLGEKIKVGGMCYTNLNLNINFRSKNFKRADKNKVLSSSMDEKGVR
jgi:hypothetical protein